MQFTYYHATTPISHHAAIAKGQHDCDVCVIGAGLTGISTAFYLQKSGLSVILLEADTFASGASGQNGGHLMQGYARGMSSLISGHTLSKARDMWNLASESVDLVTHNIAEYNIDCGLRWGSLLTALKPRHIDDFTAEIDTLTKHFNADHLQLLGKAETQEAVNSSKYIGGLFDPKSGQLHPVRYAAGLLQAFIQMGGQFFEKSPALSIQKTNPAIVKTPLAEIHSSFVSVCCDTKIHHLIPSLQKYALPIGGYVVATEPLSDNDIAQSMPKDWAVIENVFVIKYFRLSEDKRLILGGRETYWGLDHKDIAQSMYPILQGIFPQLKHIGINYEWAGQIGITSNRLPHMGRTAPNIYFAHGFSGQGLALTGLYGKLMAEAIQGQAQRYDILAKIKHLPFPGGVFRPFLFPMGMLYYKLRDML